MRTINQCQARLVRTNYLRALVARNGIMTQEDRDRLAQRLRAARRGEGVRVSLTWAR
jgi:hypothetical protein